jgi:hypothetical protein
VSDESPDSSTSESTKAIQPEEIGNPRPVQGQTLFQKYEAQDRTRWWLGFVLILVGVLIFIGFSIWAFHSADRFLAGEISEYALLAKSIVFASAVAFSVGLIKFGERLVTPLVIVTEIDTARANANTKAPAPLTERSLKLLLAELRSLLSNNQST